MAIGYVESAERERVHRELAKLGLIRRNQKGYWRITDKGRAWGKILLAIDIVTRSDEPTTNVVRLQ
jgi:Mn-dependent DtxR family transcriptional regulator